MALGNTHYSINSNSSLSLFTNTQMSINGITMDNYVGSYLFGEHELPDGSTVVALSIAMRKKPNFIKRFFMKHLLGFVWRSV